MYDSELFFDGKSDNSSNDNFRLNVFNSHALVEFTKEKAKNELEKIITRDVHKKPRLHSINVTHTKICLDQKIVTHLAFERAPIKVMNESVLYLQT